MNSTPRAAAAGWLPSSSQKCQSITAKVRFSRLAKNSGIENALTAWAATQIHAATKAGHINGQVICQIMRRGPAPLTSPAAAVLPLTI